MGTNSFKMRDGKAGHIRANTVICFGFKGETSHKWEIGDLRRFHIQFMGACPKLITWKIPFTVRVSRGILNDSVFVAEFTFHVPGGLQCPESEFSKASDAGNSNDHDSWQIFVSLTFNQFSLCLARSLRCNVVLQGGIELQASFLLLLACLNWMLCHCTSNQVQLLHNSHWTCLNEHASFQHLISK